MNKIKELRQHKGLSQKQLADMLNVHQTAVSQRENGRTSPDMEILKRIAGLFEVSTDYLLDIKTAPVNTTKADDDDMADLLEEVRRRPDLKALFSLSKNATPDDVRKTIKIMEALKGDDGTGDY